MERFRENFQRNGLGEGFLFLKGCIKKVWVNTKSPKADHVGLQTCHHGSLQGVCVGRVSPPPTLPKSSRKGGNHMGEVPEPGQSRVPALAFGGRTTLGLLSRGCCHAPARGQAPCLPLRWSTGPPSPRKMNEDTGIQRDQATGLGYAP